MAFALEKMAQFGIGFRRQLPRQFVNAGKERGQIWFSLDGGHRLDGIVQSGQRVEQLLFDRRFHFQNGSRVARCVTKVSTGLKFPPRHQVVTNRSSAVIMAIKKALMKYNPKASGGSGSMTRGTPL